jgi:hypothetical protein
MSQLPPPPARPPLPAQLRRCRELHQRGERAGVWGSGGEGVRPLATTLVRCTQARREGSDPSCAQAGRGDAVGVRGSGCRPALGGVAGLLLALCLMLGSAIIAHAAEVTFDLKIENGQVAKNMRLIRVKQGDAVTLRWTTDRPIVLHLHGYDIEKKVEPGAVTEMAFLARATGRFSVEEHKTDAKGGHSHGEAALVRIDVLPQ